MLYLRFNFNVLIKRQVLAHLPTDWGDFDMYAYAENSDQMQPHLALVNKNTDLSETVSVRIHSECLTGDLFRSKRCDCGAQLEASLQMIKKDGGLLIYLRQEGRGIGLINKLKAYNLQDKGMDTIEANVHLGFEPDERDFEIAIDILRDLKIKRINLITNNPEKLAAIGNSEIKLSSRIPIIIPSGKENDAYLKVKQKMMGHLLT